MTARPNLRYALPATSAHAGVLDQEPLFLPSILGPEEAMARAPAFAPLITLWCDRRGDSHAPCWRQMDFQDFLGWHPDLVLSAFEGDEPDPLFRLVGETFSAMTGAPMKGKRFSAFSRELYDGGMREHFRKLRETAGIGLGQGRVATPGRDHLGLQVLELPFCDGGERIERLVHVVKPIPL
ncbi:MAG: PAS domain-containing protein [Alphaproteobacteria bacterium]|nr:PAS domain-containing protein [Alphaproteobacteria bacterium]